jgi:hypothetical protein
MFLFFQPFALKSAFSTFFCSVLCVLFQLLCAVNLLLYEFEQIFQHPLHHQGQELPGKMFFVVVVPFVKFSDAEFLMMPYIR